MPPDADLRIVGYALEPDTILPVERANALGSRISFCGFCARPVDRPEHVHKIPDLQDYRANDCPAD